MLRFAVDAFARKPRSKDQKKPSATETQEKQTADAALLAARTHLAWVVLYLSLAS